MSHCVSLVDLFANLSQGSLFFQFSVCVQGNAHVYKESYLSPQEGMECYHSVKNHLQQSEAVHQLNSPSFHHEISSHFPYKMELKGFLDGCYHYYFCLYRYYGNKHTKEKVRTITSKQTYLTKRLCFIVNA